MNDHRDTTSRSLSSSDRTAKEHAKLVRHLAARVLHLSTELAAERKALLAALAPNERVILPGKGTFQAVPTGWHPDAAFTRWLVEHKLLDKVVVPKPSISMSLVNALAKTNATLAGYITLARAAASERLSLRFRVEGGAENEDESA